MSANRNIPVEGVLLSLCLGAAVWWAWGDPAPITRAAADKGDSKKDERRNGEICFDEKVGNTPLVLIRSLSELTGCRIMAKMECRNPGGSGKDRPALYMLKDMAGRLHDAGLDAKGAQVVESTSGNTGISLAAVCQDLALELHIVMPDDQSIEKSRKLEELGAKVKTVANCSIANAKHYVNDARRLAADTSQLAQGVHLNQFENLANTKAHQESTGPELRKQCGKLDAFVMSAGTGGTIAGVSRFYSSVQAIMGGNEGDGEGTEFILADPQGSSLYHKVVNGVCYTPQQREQKQRKHRYDTIVEGVGLDRVTANFDRALIHSAESVSDQEMVNMAHWLLHKDGIFVSSSSALNLVAALRVARRLGPGKTVATIICESGQRHLPRFWNPQYLKEMDLVWPEIHSLTV